MNRTEHLLVCLMEEAAEVQQAASKALRLGLDRHNPATGNTNASEIRKEFYDMDTVMEMLQDAGSVPPYIPLVEAWKGKKRKKVEEWLEVAKREGTLDE